MTNYIFIHIPKNGGMSIRYAPELKGCVLPAVQQTHKSFQYTAELETKMRQTNDEPGYEHARYRDINPVAYLYYKPFAIIRNPWDRVVSRYFFAKKVIEIENKVPSSYAATSSFEAFLEERHIWGSEDFMWHRAIRGWYNAFDYVVDPTDGNVPVDILRFEHYDEDTQKYFGLSKPLRPRNVTDLNKRHYTDIYNNETIQIVADWYAKDIEYWGYDFDSGPTRNYWNK